MCPSSVAPLNCVCVRPAMHPAWRRYSSAAYSRYSPSSRLATRAPRRPRCDNALQIRDTGNPTSDTLPAVSGELRDLVAEQRERAFHAFPVPVVHATWRLAVAFGRHFPPEGGVNRDGIAANVIGVAQGNGEHAVSAPMTCDHGSTRRVRLVNSL